MEITAHKLGTIQYWYQHTTHIPLLELEVLV